MWTIGFVWAIVMAPSLAAGLSPDSTVAVAVFPALALVMLVCDVASCRFALHSGAKSHRV